LTTAPILALAMLLDAALGEPNWLWSRAPHPAVLMGRAVGWLDKTLNSGAAQRFKGCGAVACLVICAAILGIALGAFNPLIEIIIAAILLAQRSLVQHVQAVSDALRLSTADARRMVARIVSRETAQMSDSDIARAAIESASENLSDGVIAPAFWFLIGGLPGLLIYKAINTADSMIGYRTPRHAQFGWATARLDDLLNLIPARLTALLIAATCGILRQWPAIAADARLHRSPNAGWPESAMARALSVALAGPRRYDGQLQDLHWVNGTGNRHIGPDQIDAAIAGLWRAWALALVICIVIAIL
jgi:adenosylcobinamide-phosphate synthase